MKNGLCFGYLDKRKAAPKLIETALMFILNEI